MRNGVIWEAGLAVQADASARMRVGSVELGRSLAVGAGNVCIGFEFLSKSAIMIASKSWG